MNKNLTKHQVESSPAIKANTASYDENYILSKNGILNIYGNCSLQEIDKAIYESTEFGITLIQFVRKFHVKFEALELINNKVLTKYPKCSLRQVFNKNGVFENLNFLEYLYNLQNLRISVFGELDLNPINKFCKLKALAIGGPNSKIKQITTHDSIEQLFVFEKIKDVEFIGKMGNLMHLTISKMTLNNLNFLVQLNNLKELHFLLGGTKNLENIDKIGKIEKLSFTMVRELKIENLRPIIKMNHLKKLKFVKQPHLTNLNWLNNPNIEVEVVNCKNYKS